MNELMNLDDSYNAARKARIDADALRQRFELFASHLNEFETNSFSFGDLGISVALGSDFFDLKSSAQTIRFYLSIRQESDGYIALVKVFKLPTHETIDGPAEVGSFTMNRQGETSLTLNNQAITLYAVRVSVPVALHFFATALTRVLPPAVAQ